MKAGKKLIWFALVAIIGLGGMNLILAPPSTIPENFSPVEVALGDQIGIWLGQDTRKVLVVDTDWPVAHLRTLAAGRLAGLRHALPMATIEMIEAQGYDDQANAWARALDKLSDSTTVVAFFGIPSSHDLPTSYRKLVVVGDHEEKGLPQGVDRLRDCLLIKARPNMLAPVSQVTWQGTNAERFAAAYEILPHAPDQKTP